MIIDTNSFIVSGVNLGTYLTSVNFNKPKLWGSDSGRNLQGKQVGTLIGIFPKFELQFGRLTKNQLETIAPILDAATQMVSYYEPATQSQKTIETYAGDWAYEVDTIGQIKPFKVNLIARDRRV